MKKNLIYSMPFIVAMLLLSGALSVEHATIRTQWANAKSNFSRLTIDKDGHLVHVLRPENYSASVETKDSVSCALEEKYSIVSFNSIKRIFALGRQLAVIIPIFKHSYRTNEERGIVGHLLGGVFVAYCSITKPMLSQEHSLPCHSICENKSEGVALSPSTGFEDKTDLPVELPSVTAPLKCYTLANNR